MGFFGCRFCFLVGRFFRSIITFFISRNRGFVVGIRYCSSFIYSFILLVSVILWLWFRVVSDRNLFKISVSEKGGVKVYVFGRFRKTF